MRRVRKELRQNDPNMGHSLESDLQKVLEDVGPGAYARATARRFAKGGEYNPKPKRPRYAIT